MSRRRSARINTARVRSHRPQVGKFFFCSVPAASAERPEAGRARLRTEPYSPSTALLTSTFTATRRFCALPSGVLLSASGSAFAMPVGVSMR